MRPLYPLFAVVLWAAALPLLALEGNRLIGVGPVQLGQAGAGVADGGDSTWLGLNPAALHGLGRRVDGSVYALFASDSIEPKGALGNPTAGRMDDDATALVPNITGSYPLGPGTLGAGIYGIGGLDLQWPEARSVVGALGGFDTRAEARIVRAAIGYALPLPSDWQVGVALDLDHLSFASDALTGSLTQTKGAGATDRAWGGGFIIGAQKRFEDVTLGLAYHSRHWMQTLEDYDDLLIGPVDQPQMLQAGVAWRVTPITTVLIDYRFLDWDSVAVFGDEDDGFGWEEQHIGKAAVAVTPRDELTLRAGLSYGKSPIRDDDVFVNGLTPLIGELHGSIGASWRFNEQGELHFAYVRAFENDVTDDGGDVSGAGAGTVIELVVDSVALGVGWTF